MPILNPDDLNVGEFVAVHSLRAAATTSIETPRDFAMARANRPKSPVPLGAPVEVIAVNLPFVLVAVVLPGGGSSGPVLLDIRDVRLMPVPEEMVHALRERFQAPPSLKESLRAWKHSGQGPAEVLVDVDSVDEAGDGLEEGEEDDTD